jgi:hypothetical protein
VQRRNRFTKGDDMKAHALVVLLVSSLLALAQVAQAQDHFYCLIDPGNEKWFMKANDPQEQLHYWCPGETISGANVRWVERIVDGIVQGQTCYLYSVNTEGDVFSHGVCEYPSDPWLYIDAPLFSGKSWQSCFLGVCFDFLVTGEEAITVPFGGPYHCYVLEIRDSSDGSLIEVDWLNDGAGIIQWQESVDTYVLLDGVITVESQTWGGLKALYR